jgi:hypothetical protein
MRPVATYSLESADGGAQFTRRVEMPLQGAMRILKPLMRRMIRKRNARLVQNLKQLVEGVSAEA